MFSQKQGQILTAGVLQSLKDAEASGTEITWDQYKFFDYFVTSKEYVKAAQIIYGYVLLNPEFDTLKNWSIGKDLINEAANHFGMVYHELLNEEADPRPALRIDFDSKLIFDEYGTPLKLITDKGSYQAQKITNRFKHTAYVIVIDGDLKRAKEVLENNGFDDDFTSNPLFFFFNDVIGDYSYEENVYYMTWENQQPECTQFYEFEALSVKVARSLHEDTIDETDYTTKLSVEDQIIWLRKYKQAWWELDSKSEQEYDDAVNEMANNYKFWLEVNDLPNISADELLIKLVNENPIQLDPIVQDVLDSSEEQVFDYNIYVEDSKLNIGVRSNKPFTGPNGEESIEDGEGIHKYFNYFYLSPPEEFNAPNLGNLKASFDFTKSLKNPGWTITADNNYTEFIKMFQREGINEIKPLSIDNQKLWLTNFIEYWDNWESSDQTGAGDEFLVSLLNEFLSNQGLPLLSADDVLYGLNNGTIAPLSESGLLTEIKVGDIDYQIDWLDTFNTAWDNWSEGGQADVEQRYLVSALEEFTKINSLPVMSADELQHYLEVEKVGGPDAEPDDLVQQIIENKIEPIDNGLLIYSSGLNWAQYQIIKYLTDLATRFEDINDLEREEFNKIQSELIDEYNAFQKEYGYTSLGLDVDDLRHHIEFEPMTYKELEKFIYNLSESNDWDGYNKQLELLGIDKDPGAAQLVTEMSNLVSIDIDGFDEYFSSYPVQANDFSIGLLTICEQMTSHEEALSILGENMQLESFTPGVNDKIFVYDGIYFYREASGKFWIEEGNQLFETMDFDEMCKYAANISETN